MASGALRFPNEIFVRRDSNDDSTENLLAYTARDKAVEEDGTTDVAVYELVRVKKLKKQVVEA